MDDNIQSRLNAIERAHDELINRLNMLDAKMDAQLKWIIGTILTFCGGIMLHFSIHMDL